MKKFHLLRDFSAATPLLVLMAVTAIILSLPETVDAQTGEAEPIARQACEARLGAVTERSAFLRDNGWLDLAPNAGETILKSVGKSVFALNHDQWDVGLYDASEMKKQFDIYAERYRRILESVRDAPDAASVMVDGPHPNAIIFLQLETFSRNGLACQIWLTDGQVSDRLRTLTANLKGKRDAFFASALVNRPTTERPALTTLDIIDAGGFEREFGISLEFTWRMQIIQTVLEPAAVVAD